MKLARRLDRRTALRAKSRRAAIKDQFRRGLQTERLEDRQLLAGDVISPFLASSNSAYYNYSIPTDVTADGYIAPGDALAVINTLNDGGSRQLPQTSAEGEASSKLYVDVNNDGWVSPADALTVINRLNAEGAPPDSDDKVEYVFSAIDPTTGNPTTTVGAGKTFFLVMSARDLRPEGTFIDDNGTPTNPNDDEERERIRGVYAAYADVLFDRNEVSPAVFEVQNIALPSNSTGTFKLTVNGVDTANIAFDSRSAGRAGTVTAIQNALNAALGGPGQVVVTNNINNFRVQFVGQVNVDVAPMTAKDVVFTLGSGTINITEFIKGDPTNSDAILNSVTFSSQYLNGPSALNGTNPDRIDELGAFFSGQTSVGAGVGLNEVLRVLMIAKELPDGVSTEQTVFTPDFVNMVRPADDTLVFANLQIQDEEPRESQDVLVNQIAFNTLTLTITGGAINAVPDTNTVNEDATAGVTTNVIANDTLNPPATGTIELRSVGAVSPAGAGTATRVGNSIQFVPAANFAGTVTIPYTAGLVGSSNPDDTGDSVLTITVNAINDAPAIAAIAAQNVNEDTLTTVNLTGIGPGGGTDEAGQNLTVTAVTTTNPALIPNITVNFTGGSSGTLEFTPASNASGTATITVTVQDDGGTANGGVNTTTRTFEVNVAAANDAPENRINGVAFTSGPDQITVPGTALDFNALGGNQLSVADVDAGTNNIQVTLSLGAGQGTLDVGTAAGVTVAGDNSASVTLTGPQAAINTAISTVTYTPAAGFSGTATLTMTTNDQGNSPAPAQTTTSTITIKLDPGVRPFAVDDRPPAITEGSTTPITIDALANDFKETGTTITTVNNPPAGQGTATLVAGQIQYTPPGGDFFTPPFTPVAFTYVIDGPTVGTPTEEDRRGTVFITINNINDAPVAVNDNYATAIGVPLQINAPGVLANDTDVDNPGNTLAAVNAQIAAGQGSVSLSESGAFVYTPPAGVGGDFTFTYQVRDPAGALSTAATVSIHVAAPPQAQNDTFTAVEDTANQALGNVLTNDSDPTENQPLSAVLVTNVPSAVGSVTLAANGAVTFTPAANFNTTRPPASPITFTYKATAGGRDSNVATASITVNEVNDNPTATDDTAIAVRRSGSPPNEIGVDQDIAVLANDTFAPDVNETLKVTGVNGQTADASGNTAPVATTGGGSVRLVNFQIKYTARTTAGPDSITYTVSDFDATSGTARGGSDTGAVAIDVVDFVPKVISGTVFVDADNDGVLDAGERRLGGVDLRLTGTDFTGLAVDILVSTDINGDYAFGAAGSGQLIKPPSAAGYTLTQIQPAYLLNGLESNSTNTQVLANSNRLDDKFGLFWGVTQGGDISGLNFGERGVDISSLSDSSGFLQEFLASSGPNGIVMAGSLSGEILWNWNLPGWENAKSLSISLSSDLSILTISGTDKQDNAFSVSLHQSPSIPGSMARFRILGIGQNGQYIIRIDGSAAECGLNLLAAAPAGSGGEGEGSAQAYAGSADAVFTEQAWA